MLGFKLINVSKRDLIEIVFKDSMKQRSFSALNSKQYNAQYVLEQN